MPDFLKLREKLHDVLDPQEQEPQPSAQSPEVQAIAAPEAKGAQRSPEAGEQASESKDQASSGQTGSHVSHVVPLKDRVQSPHTKSERLVAIERIMSDRLGDIYMGLDPAPQQAVKAAGEDAAGKIEQLIEEGKAAAKSVLKILQTWLKKIPGVNRYFLEQESKIKTDRIMAVVRKTRGEDA